MGRWCTLIGVIISIGTAYLVMQFHSIMWTRATKAGGFWGLLAGTLSSIGMWGWVKVDHSALRYIAMSPDAKDMAENMYRALWSGLICALVTILVSLLTKRQPVEELKGLAYGTARGAGFAIT